MSTFVNEENTGYRPDNVYGNVIAKIKEDGVCPFCEKNLPNYHKKPILKKGKYWLLTDNMYPYEGAKYHLLFVHREHIDHLRKMTTEAWAELYELVEEAIKERNIKGGAFLMRFGETSYTGASVTHLHANLIVADPSREGSRPIMTRLG